MRTLFGVSSNLQCSIEDPTPCTEVVDPLISQLPEIRRNLFKLGLFRSSGGHFNNITSPVRYIDHRFRGQVHVFRALFGVERSTLDLGFARELRIFASSLAAIQDDAKESTLLHHDLKSALTDDGSWGPNVCEATVNLIGSPERIQKIVQDELTYLETLIKKHDKELDEKQDEKLHSYIIDDIKNKKNVYKKIYENGEFTSVALCKFKRNWIYHDEDSPTPTLPLSSALMSAARDNLRVAEKARKLVTPFSSTQECIDVATAGGAVPVGEHRPNASHNDDAEKEPYDALLFKSARDICGRIIDAWNLMDLHASPTRETSRLDSDGYLTIGPTRDDHSSNSGIGCTEGKVPFAPEVLPRLLTIEGLIPPIFPRGLKLRCFKLERPLYLHGLTIPFGLSFNNVILNGTRNQFALSIYETSFSAPVKLENTKFRGRIEIFASVFESRLLFTKLIFSSCKKNSIDMARGFDALPCYNIKAPSNFFDPLIKIENSTFMHGLSFDTSDTGIDGDATNSLARRLCPDWWSSPSGDTVLESYQCRETTREKARAPSIRVTNNSMNGDLQINDTTFQDKFEINYNQFENILISRSRFKGGFELRDNVAQNIDLNALTFINSDDRLYYQRPLIRFARKNNIRQKLGIYYIKLDSKPRLDVSINTVGKTLELWIPDVHAFSNLQLNSNEVGGSTEIMPPLNIQSTCYRAPENGPRLPLRFNEFGRVLEIRRPPKGYIDAFAYKADASADHEKSDRRREWCRDWRKVELDLTGSRVDHLRWDERFLTATTGRENSQCDDSSPVTYSLMYRWKGDRFRYNEWSKFTFSGAAESGSDADDAHSDYINWLKCNRFKHKLSENADIFNYASEYLHRQAAFDESLAYLEKAKELSYYPTFTNEDGQPFLKEKLSFWALAMRLPNLSYQAFFGPKERAELLATLQYLYLAPTGYGANPPRALLILFVGTLFMTLVYWSYTCFMQRSHTSDSGVGDGQSAPKEAGSSSGGETAMGVVDRLISGLAGALRILWSCLTWLVRGSHFDRHPKGRPGFIAFDPDPEKEPRNFTALRYSLDVSLPVINMHVYDTFVPEHRIIRIIAALHHLVGWWLVTAFLASAAVL